MYFCQKNNLMKTVNRKITCLFSAVLLFCAFLNAETVRKEYLLDKGWKFTREDSPSFVNESFNDSKWETVTLPHDWAIYGPFNIYNDKQNVAIAQDGQKNALEHAGRTGGLPFVGAGWYRLPFDVPQFEAGKRVMLLFDGAMSNARVYINGREAGYWAYGYNTFYFDITDYLHDSGENTLAVRLENSAESSRWYPGAGLYRNVHLIVTDDIHIPLWGTQIMTPVVGKDNAKIVIKTGFEYPEQTKGDFELRTSIIDPSGTEIGCISSKIDMKSLDNEGYYETNIWVENPKLWSPENPVLYQSLSRLYYNGALKDEYETRFGIRSIEIRPNDGFYLNGVKTYFKGVCNHHDLGPLGAAVNDAAIRRRIRILKDMGCNAIRTSHNMPAPELIRACDEMGMMVMAESFDEWKTPKVKNGYNLYYNDWVEKDLIHLVRQFRNNPSVVMWCIGNEVPDQTAKGGVYLARMMQDICHREDPTRPVTVGMDRGSAVINNNFAATLDVVGFNYRLHVYQEAYDKLPQQIILGSETASTVSSRGVYKFPVERRTMAKYPDHQSSGYDLEHCDWSNLPEDDFIQHEDRPWCIGEFVWTGFDYLGEPTPYYSDWPNHSSLFGIIDLAGIPKDRYYLYRSHWNKKEETLHVLPHWNWAGREGEITPVFVYTNYPSAELFINGKSQGKRTKDLSVTLENSNNKEAEKALMRQKRYRLMWMDTKYEPGTVKVVAYDRDGKAVAEKEIHTAGKPHHIELTADRTQLKADGKDLSFMRVRIVDENGNLCPDETRKIQFKVKGAGVYRAAANGDPTCLELFHLPEMSLFAGELTAIVQTTEKQGEIIFEASAKGVKSGKITLRSE
jgi:beta-galactosidase